MSWPGAPPLKIKDKTLAGKNYQEITSDNVKNVGGKGQTDGTPFVVTGSIDVNRSATLPLP
jgi:hypothetical protein